MPHPPLQVRAMLEGVPPELATCAMAALQARGMTLTEASGPDLLLLGTGSAEAARAEIARLAEALPAAVHEGADLRASAQVIWLMPAFSAGRLSGTLREAALAHAPKLRVNAVQLSARRPKAEPWQAAWNAAQQHPAALPLPQALTLALTYLLETPALTGVLVNAHGAL